MGDQRRVLLCLHRRVMKTASADLPTFRSWPTTSKRPGASWRARASSFCRSPSKRTGAPPQFSPIPTAISSCSAHPDESHAGVPDFACQRSQCSTARSGLATRRQSCRTGAVQQRCVGRSAFGNVSSRLGSSGLAAFRYSVAAWGRFRQASAARLSPVRAHARTGWRCLSQRWSPIVSTTMTTVIASVTLAERLCVDGIHSVLASALTGNPRNLASENPEAAERVT